jgi:hypothetical protein
MPASRKAEACLSRRIEAFDKDKDPRTWYTRGAEIRQEIERGARHCPGSQRKGHPAGRKVK